MRIYLENIIIMRYTYIKYNLTKTVTHYMHNMKIILFRLILNNSNYNIILTLIQKNIFIFVLIAFQ